MQALAPARSTRPLEALPRLTQPVAGITPVELQDAISALLDREDLAPPDERARLRRVRADLERRAGDMLDE